jgi:hypothetical protein
MSFLRHGESIDPMTFVSPGASGLAHSQCSSASMSSSRLFLGRLLSSRACFHFAGHERFSKTKPSRTMIFQRTATTPLTPCLSPRVHSILLPPPSREKRVWRLASSPASFWEGFWVCCFGYAQPSLTPIQPVFRSDRFVNS